MFINATGFIGLKDTVILKTVTMLLFLWEKLNKKNYVRAEEHITFVGFKSNKLRWHIGYINKKRRQQWNNMNIFSSLLIE